MNKLVNIILILAFVVSLGTAAPNQLLVVPRSDVVATIAKLDTLDYLQAGNVINQLSIENLMEQVRLRDSVQARSDSIALLRDDALKASQDRTEAQGKALGKWKTATWCLAGSTVLLGAVTVLLGLRK